MDKFISLLQEINNPHISSANSFVDRLNSNITPTILCVYAIILTIRHYIGTSITCWCPTHFTTNNIDYVNKVCWTTGVYHLSNEERIPSNLNKINYYQYVIIFPVFQAILFYIPHILWKRLSYKNGIPIHELIDNVNKRAKKIDNPDKYIDFVVKQIEYTLRGTICSTLRNNYLVCVYLFIKLLYIINIIAQMFIINKFLDDSFYLYGINVIERIFTNDTWISPQFPRIVLCKFNVYNIGNINENYVQCILPMNIFNEIFFIFIWYWLVILIVVTVVSFWIWSYQIFNNNSQVNLIRHILNNENITKLFILRYLSRDGCFIIRLIKENTNDYLAGELVARLWVNY